MLWKSGSKIFNEHVMKERLPSATYRAWRTLHKGAPLDIEGVTLWPA